MLAGAFETIFLLSGLANLALVVYTRTLSYNIVMIVLKPILVDLPNVAAYCRLLAHRMNRAQRHSYTRTRAITFAFFFVISGVHMFMSYKIITSNYKQSYCNNRGSRDSEEDYQEYLSSPEYN